MSTLLLNDPLCKKIFYPIICISQVRYVTGDISIQITKNHFARVAIQQLRGHNFALFEPPTHLNVVKYMLFWANYPPHLVHVVIERPPNK